MKRAVFLVVVFAFTGCSSTSIYKMVEDEIINPEAATLRYAANWYRTRPLDVIGPANEREAFYKDVAACADSLEERRKEFLKRVNPTKGLAALQMNECLSEKGWQVKVVEEITIS